ncbi:MAG: GlsB/YeaQ/YmgE family stress response membrane protein [Burkholderiales bacterium]
MDLIISLVIGGIVGWLASIVMKTNAQMGWIANVLVGVVGSALGFWLAGMIGLEASGGILRFAVAIAGAALLIFILSLLGVFRRS